jgi:2-oxoglutarate ferredoxin oxidoreductase subunit gamma
MGQIIAYAGMIEDKNVTWLPSYGPEMRGGTANCNVIVSDQDIASPLVNSASTVIVMNKPSLEKFESQVAPGGHLYINSSLIDIKTTRDDINVHYIPASDLAIKIGNVRVANMIILGAFLANTHLLSNESVHEALTKVLGINKEHLIIINENALMTGEKLAAS